MKNGNSMCMRAAVNCFISIIISSAVAADDGTDSETRLPTKLIRSPAIDTIGGESMDVFVSVSPAPGNPTLYYTYPLFRPGFDHFKSAVESICKPASRGNSVRTVALPIEFWSNSYRTELAQKLSEELDRQISQNVIFVYPHYQIVVRTLINGKSTILERFPANPMDPMASLPNRTSLPFTTQNVNIRGTCAELRIIAADTSVVKADMYAKNDTANLDMVTLQYDAVIKSLVANDIDIATTQTGSIVVSTRSSGEYGRTGISLLGPVNVATGGANSSGSVTTTDTRQRYSSQSYINELAHNVSINFKINSVIESTAISTKDVGDQLTKFVLENAQGVTAKFEQTAANQLKLVVDGVDYVLGKSSVDMLMSGKPGAKTKLDSESDKSVEYEAMKAAEKKKEGAQFETSDDITWKHDGTDWVPVSVKLKAYSLASLQNSSRATDSVVRVARRTTLVAVELSPIGKVGIEWRSWALRTATAEKRVEELTKALAVERGNIIQLNNTLNALGTRAADYEARLAPAEAYFKAMRDCFSVPGNLWYGYCQSPGPAG